MKIRVFAALLATSGALAACVQGNVVQESPGAVDASAAWMTTSGNGTGPVLVAALTPDGDTKTVASVKLTGASAGATYAWHVHYGSCTNDIGVIGESSVYPQLTVGPNGEGSSEASLPFTTPSKKSGSFFVKVHEAGNMSNVIVCRELSPRTVRAANY